MDYDDTYSDSMMIYVIFISLMVRNRNYFNNKPKKKSYVKKKKKLETNEIRKVKKNRKTKTSGINNKA